MLKHELRTAVVCVIAGLMVNAAAHAAPIDRSSLTLLDPKTVQLGGPLGQALDRGIRRLGQEPFTTDWLLADVSFKMDRIFTNYSGDASGRFVELAALTSPAGQLNPPAFGPVIRAITSFQKADGHFGLDVDLAKPLPKLATPIPMLWGNARLLVGLVTAAHELNNPKLLDSAKRLGDFYVESATQLCSPSRLAEYKASGTYGDGYTCCYFPAIEGLVLLYTATYDARYLDQASRMAEFFQSFDVLPVDHSHGNLCAWRGILGLYGVTGDRTYLDRAIAKWQAAVQGGYVWPLGGIGEHWYISFEGDEGCSESDWLRFNLDLWRFTGDTRYLDMAERLLANQYLEDQCPNGGYGMRHFDGDSAGPIGTRGRVDEWPFCCSFHGPLGLHYLKAYLAAGAPAGVYLNFPLAFTAPLNGGGHEWILTVSNPGYQSSGAYRAEIMLAPKDTPSATEGVLWIRVPDWATETHCETADGQTVPGSLERGYLRIQRAFKPDAKLVVFFNTRKVLEGPRFQPMATAEPGREVLLTNATALLGPHVLVASPAPAAGKCLLLATIDSGGHIGFPRNQRGTSWTIALPQPNSTTLDVDAALDSARPVALRPWPSVQTLRRVTFVNDYWVIPAERISPAALERFAARLKSTPPVPGSSVYGEHLEKKAEAWIGASGWDFRPDELRVRGGDVGLIDGIGYADYRFEFDLQIPKDGYGIAGWVVRGETESDCLMFQIQTADSPYKAPEFKTHPNTLRPHLRRNGQWTIQDPVALPREVRCGEVHHVAVECRGDKIEVFLDNTHVHSQTAFGLRNGGVGFRAGGPAEEGRFRNISLKKL